MDKYEYKLKTEEMLELMEDGEYRKAAAAADLIDWKRVRNAGMLMNVSDIYEKTKEYQKSYDVMNLAYRRSEGSRKVIYKLCSLAIKTKNIDEAIDYYDEFIQIAPKDPNRHILRYQILRAQRAPIEQQIEALEEFKKAEYIEEWAYELAKLYREAGMMTECLEECDDLILWFSEGKYVYKAMELKMQYKPLSPSQQQKYDHRYEKLSSETEEIPDLASYLGEDEEKDSASEGAEALGDTRSIGLTEQPVMENDSTSDVIDTDAVTLEAAEEPDAEVENPEEAGVETAEVIEVSEDESEVQPATVETSGDKRTLSKDTASIPIVSKNPVKPVKKKLGDTMRLDEALQQLLNPKPEVQAEPGEEVEPDMTDLEEDIAAIEDVEDLEIVNQLTEEKKAEEANKERVVPSGMKELIPEPETEEELIEQAVEETSEDVPEDAVAIEAGEAESEEVLEVEEAEPEEEEILEEGENTIVSQLTLDEQKKELDTELSEKILETEETFVGEKEGFRPHILIVEDNDSIRRMLAELFEGMYEVTTAVNGQDALEKVEEASPHIILSDVLMPRMSGIELVKQLKGNLDTCHIPVVLLTARTEIEQNLEGLKIGADDYITKPFDSRLLVFRCNNLVNNRRKLQEYFTKQPTVETPVLATNPLDKEFLDEVIAVFEQHLDDSDFTIDMLAQKMLVSRTRMYAKIKAITGQTPNDFFITLRLKKAAFLLRNNPEMNVTQISDQTGFSSPRYFSKLFKKAYQLTPMAYRQGEE